MQFKESAPSVSDSRISEKNEKGPIILDETILALLDEKHSKYFTGRNEEMRKKFGDFFNTPLNARRVVEKYFRNLSLTPELLQNKTALYLGSANSMFDEYCERKYGASFVSIDIDEENLGKDHPQGVVADARSLPFKEGAFDLVISQASMPHVLVPSTDDKGDPIKIEAEIEEGAVNGVISLFRETYRVLKSGGEIRFSTFSEKEMSDFKIETEQEKNDLDQHLSRIFLIKKTLQKFKRDSGADCSFIDTEEGGLIIIKKP